MSLYSIIQNGIGILTYSPYFFLIGNDSGKPLIIDSNTIQKCLGGNNNGIIVTFPYRENAVMWLLQCLYLSGITSGCLNMKQLECLYGFSL